MVLKLLALVLAAIGGLLAMTSDFRYKKGNPKEGEITSAGILAMMLLIGGLIVNAVISIEGDISSRAQQAEDLAAQNYLKSQLNDSRSAQDRLETNLTSALDTVKNLSFQSLSSSELVTLEVNWHFPEFPESLDQIFEESDVKQEDFWASLDNMTDTPDSTYSKALHVEHSVQPVLIALAVGDEDYPVQETVDLEGFGDARDIFGGGTAFRMLFPIGQGTDNAVVLGNLAGSQCSDRSDEAEDDLAALYPSEMFPCNAIKYDYTAEIIREDGGVTLRFKLDPETLPFVVGSASTEFMIIMPDQQNAMPDASHYLDPDFYHEGNFDVDNVEAGNWTNKSEIWMTINGLKYQPVQYSVERVGRQAHAPLYTDEEQPEAHFLYTVFKATLEQ